MLGMNASWHLKSSSTPKSHHPTSWHLCLKSLMELSSLLQLMFVAVFIRHVILVRIWDPKYWLYALRTLFCLVVQPCLLILVNVWNVISNNSLTVDSKQVYPLAAVWWRWNLFFCYWVLCLTRLLVERCGGGCHFPQEAAIRCLVRWFIARITCKSTLCRRRALR